MQRWLRRVGWFVLIWLASIATLAVMAFAIRLAVFAG